MTPTNKLRFVEREITTPFDYNGRVLLGDTVRIEKKNILQQWWESDYVGVSGEWRDVPVEQDSEL